MADKNSKFVCLEGIKRKNKFYTTNTPGEDPTKSAEGEVWYKVLGYANTSEEAQKILYPTKLDEELAVSNYITELNKKYGTNYNPYSLLFH